MTHQHAMHLRVLGPICLAALGGMIGPSRAGAQHMAATLPKAWNAPAPAISRAVPDSVVSPRRDYRWFGTMVGAVGLGLAAGLEARAACGNSESGPRDCTGVTIGATGLGALVGGTIGHFVGRAFKRG